MDWRKVELKTTLKHGVFTTLQDLVYPLCDRSGKAVLVKAGFQTDCASIPQLFWNLIDPTDTDYRQASVLHDALYAVHLFDRAKCDKIFLQAMKKEGCGFLKRQLVYWHVRLYGGLAWDAKSVESIALNLNFVSLEDI